MQTWEPAQKDLSEPSAFLYAGVNGSPPDGMDPESRKTTRFVVIDPGAEDSWDREKPFLTLAEAEARVRWTIARRSEAVKRVVALFASEGFHHGKYYMPCEPAKCEQCACAAMEILGLTEPEA